jgi:GNAT superfamily N-acetyltransferase
VSPAGIDVRRLAAGELQALHSAIPAWNSTEYAKRLAAQGRGELTQVVAWADAVPVGKGMVLFPGYEEYSTSAMRERCAEVRDVGVVQSARRRGVATTLIGAMEGSVRERGMDRIGLTVAQGEEDAPARALYERLGYGFAHGPFITSTNLWDDRGLPIPVGAVMIYLVKELG